MTHNFDLRVGAERGQPVIGEPMDQDKPQRRTMKSRCPNSDCMSSDVSHTGAGGSPEEWIWICHACDETFIRVG